MGLMDIRRRILADAPQLATATGAVASFTTDMAVPLKKCEFSIEPVQSGTGDPSPSNVRPISGWTGMNGYRTGTNLFDGVWESGSISTTTGENGGGNHIRSKNYIPIPHGQYFYFAWSGGDDYFLFMAYDSNKQFARYLGAASLSSGRLLLQDNEYYIRFYRYNQTQEPTDFRIALESTAYSPYTGTTIPVEFPAQGVNQWDEQLEEGYYDTTTGEKVSSASWVRTKNLISCKPSTSYYFHISGEYSGSWGAMLYYGANGSFISAKTDSIGGTVFTTPANCYYMAFHAKVGWATANISINYPATDTAYHAYTNTVYGGTVDVVTGQLVVNKICAKLTGTAINAMWEQAGSNTLGFYRSNYFQSNTGLPLPYRSGTGIVEVGMFDYCKTGSVYGTDTPWVAGVVFNGSTFARFNIRIPRSELDTENVAGAQAYLNAHPLQACYEIEPITYQLTPQQITALKGANNVWCDTGNTTVKYWKH